MRRSTIPDLEIPRNAPFSTHLTDRIPVFQEEEAATVTIWIGSKEEDEDGAFISYVFPARVLSGLADMLWSSVLKTRLHGGRLETQ